MDDHPLKKLVSLWLKNIRKAAKDKKAKFQRDADEAMSFFDGTGEWLDLMGKRTVPRNDMGEPVDQERIMPPSFQMRVNKAAEVRDLFGPAMYHKNPVVTVTPYDHVMVPPEALGIIPDPMNPYDPALGEYQQLVQQQQLANSVNVTRAELIRRMLDYGQQEADKKSHARRCIDEALIMGRGVLWHEFIEAEDGVKVIGSFYDSVRRLYLDPDARVWEDVRWAARKCIHPRWKVQEEYGLDDETADKLDCPEESYENEAALEEDADANDKRSRGKSNDLVVYYKVYSKMGMGENLKGGPKELRGKMDEFGENCYLVIAEGVPYPLNLPEDLRQMQTQENPENGAQEFAWPQEIVTNEMGMPVMEDGQPLPMDEMGQPVPGFEPLTQLRTDVFLAFQWPIPYWADRSWPFEVLDYHEKPDCVWPISHLKPAIGELRFINWCMSFLAVKVKRVCQTTIGVNAALEDDIVSQLLSGVDYNIVKITTDLGADVNKLVSFLQAPGFNPEIWQMLSAVFDLFDKRVGLTELAYGMSSRQMRSAAEAQAKQGNFAIRPDDMANKTEDFLSRVARKEAMAWRWFAERQDVESVLGPVGAMAWERLVMSSDIGAVTREFQYRVEAGSARKPNKDKEIDDANQAMQYVMPVMQWYAGATGDMEPMNAIMQKWGRAMDVQVPLLQPPPPPPQPAPEQQAQQQPPMEQAA